MSETIDYLLKFARLPPALRRYLRQTTTADQARRIVADRMERRSEILLGLVDRCIYGLPDSPYRRLLDRAGCEPGDLRELVAREGVEGALRELRARDVYVTYEEFKGRKSIVRGSFVLDVQAADFDNPFARRDLTARTGGSTGLASPVPLGLDYFAARAPHQALFQHAYELDDVAHRVLALDPARERAAVHPAAHRPAPAIAPMVLDGGLARFRPVDQIRPRHRLRPGLDASVRRASSVARGGAPRRCAWW